MKFKMAGKACVFVVVCGACALYGAATVKFQLFPYPQLSALKKTIKPDTSITRSQYYLDRKDFFESNGKQADIVMIGDSITNRAEWPELLGVISIANRGINSDTTDGVIERMESIYSTHAKKAFIMIGINDITTGVNTDTIFNNYTTIIEGLQRNKITPNIQSTLLTRRNNEDYNIKINALNTKLIAYAKANNITFIDLNESMAEDNVLIGDYTSDGIHLSGKGYAVWANTLTKYVN